MPLVKYLCTNEQCSHTFPVLFKKASDIQVLKECPKCQKEAKRQLSGSSFQSKIVVDNGVQAKSVEIHPEIGRINHDRARLPKDRGD